MSSTPEVSGEELSLRLLGDFQVRVRGEALEGFRSGRARELLSFVVLDPDVAHARQRLAFLFWPDSSEHQARTNLRNVLHQLRRAHPVLDASLRVTPTSLQWRPVGSVTVDVERFVAAVDAAVDADPDDVVELIDRCRAAVSLYSGDLLAGDHDEWVIPLREALRGQYKDVLTRLVAALIDADRGREAVPAARELVRADSLDEASHRLRIEAHARSGDRPGAVRAYHDCVATLERELGVEPSRPTVALYESLIDSPGGVESSLRDPSVSRRHRLVGRDAEWRQIVAAWEAAQSGQPAAVLVTGEAGIGKTRLVDELQARCAESGAAIGVARSYATEGDLGHAVIASWLRSPDVAAGRPHLSDAQLGELARLLPELGAPAEMDGADQATRRRRLFDAATSALSASGRPTLLVADDAQWSDQASHELIHYVIRERRGIPLLVVLTARSEDVDECSSLSALRDALVILDRLTDVTLSRLPIEAVGQLGSQLTRSDLDDDAVNALFAESEGNPLFVVETIRGGWDGSRGRSGLTPRLRAVIEARFRQLSEPAASVLRSAAVAGRPSSAALLKMLTGLDDKSLVRGLDELWQRGILSESGADSYEFSHGKLRDAAYDRLTPASRRSLHGAVADALVQLSTGAPDSAASYVAAHLEAANRFEEAVTWLQLAAIDAQQMFAYDDAVRLIDRALALVPSLPPSTRHARELELLSTLPGVLAGVDGYGTTRMSDAHRRAADVAAGLGVELEPALERSMVMSALCRDEFSQAAATASRLSVRAATEGDLALAIESHYLLGISAFWSADLDRAREHFETVVARFDQSMRPWHHTVYGHDPVVVCLSRLANTLWFLGRDGEAREACESALAMADEVGHPLSHDTAVIFGCVLAVDLDDHDLLRRCASRLGELGMSSLPHMIKREALLGLVDVLDGRRDAGLARGLTALDSCGGRNFYPGFRATITRVLLAAHAAAEDDVGGLSTVKQALALGSTPLWNPEAHRLRAEFLRQSGADAASVSGSLDDAERIASRHRSIGQLRRIHETRQRLVTRT